MLLLLLILLQYNKATLIRAVTKASLGIKTTNGESLFKESKDEEIALAREKNRFAYEEREARRQVRKAAEDRGTSSTIRNGQTIIGQRFRS